MLCWDKKLKWIKTQTQQLYFDITVVQLNTHNSLPHVTVLYAKMVSNSNKMYEILIIYNT
jgi:hypothetical protein